MKSTRITSLNPYVTSINQKYVKAQQYNDLKDDFDTVVAAVGLNSSLTNSTSSTILTGTGTLTATQIVGNGAGTLAHADGVEIVAAPGAGYVYEILSAIAFLNFGTAAYTGGGTDLVLRLGSVSMCAAIAAASLVNLAADGMVQINLLATNTVPVVNTNINLKCSSAFTQPGTAAGVLTIKVTYRVHATGF